MIAEVIVDIAASETDRIYDYIIVNDDLEKAIADLSRIIDGE